MPGRLLSDLRLSLDGKVALVTGGGRGIGRAIALALAAAGADVAVMARTAAQLEDVAREVRSTGGRALALPGNVALPEQTGNAIAQVVDELGRLDILVNAAGVQLRKAALDVTERDWDELMAVNLRAVFFSCQAAAKVMAGQGGGIIINISSLTAVIGLPYIAPYVASRGGVGQLTKALAVEWSGRGIRVNAIGPGRMHTAMTDALFNDAEVRESFLRLIPQHRAGTPEDVGGAAVFLASDASGYITGQTIYIDGGWLASGGNPLR